MSQQNNKDEKFNSEGIRTDFEDFDVTFKHDDASNDDFTEVIIEGRHRGFEQSGEYLENVVLASGVQSLQSERFRAKTRSTRAAQKALRELDEMSVSNSSQIKSEENPSKQSQAEASEPQADIPEREEKPLEESALKEQSPESETSSVEIVSKNEKTYAPFQVDERDENSDKRRRSYHTKKSNSQFARRWRRLKGWQKGIIIFLLIFLILIVSAVSTVYLMHADGKKNMMADNYGDSFENSIFYNDVEYIYNPDITSIAFMGIDRRKFGLQDELVGTAGQSDVNMVVAVNTKTGDTNVIVIPRDTDVDVNKYSLAGDYMGTSKQQLCLAYAFGDGATTSCDNQIVSMQRILYGIPINTYVALNLDGIKPLNDAIGGVKLVCPNTFGEYKKGEEIVLDGDEAEHFIRTRETSNKGDVGRRERQIAYVKAYVETVIQKSLSNPAALTQIYNIGKEYTVTNLTLSRSLYFGTSIISNLSKVTSFENITALKGKLTEDSGGYALVELDEDDVLKTVLDIYYTPLQ